MSETILFAIEGDVARITINNPDKRNALSLGDLTAISGHLSTAADADIRALIITGAGDRAFSAGVDLSDVGSTEDWGVNPLSALCDAVQAFPKPTIARLNGAVIGGAAELSLACDFRVGVEGMKLMVPAARIGIHYEPSGLRRAVSCVGAQAAKRIYVLAEPCDAERLVQIGYLDRIATQETLDDVVEAMIDMIRLCAPLAINGMKCTFSEMASGITDEAAIRGRITETWASDDMKEGLAAVQGKRRPDFKGR
ncbi:MAG: enoyl-CoA hydratase/isomerase family protein [Pikeienuella sp.]